MQWDWIVKDLQRHQVTVKEQFPDAIWTYFGEMCSNYFLAEIRRDDGECSSVTWLQYKWDIQSSVSRLFPPQNHIFFHSVTPHFSPTQNYVHNLILPKKAGNNMHYCLQLFVVVAPDLLNDLIIKYRACLKIFPNPSIIFP